MFNPNNLISSLIMNNPNVQRNPQAQEYLQVIQNGDNRRGEQIANNICRAYGVSPEKALQDAKAFFHIQ